ncbi:MAG: TetR family transcriptional regulator [Actinomycetota bacterium]
MLLDIDHDHTRARALHATVTAALTRQRIAEAAVASGFRELSMSGVARELGVTHAALYRHVRDRDDLGYAAAEVVAQRLAWPPTDTDWETHVRDVCRLVRRTFDTHPGLYDEVARLGTVPSFTAHMHVTAEHLLACGLTPEHTMLTFEMMFHVVLDSTRLAAAEPAGEPAEIPEAMASVSISFEQKLDVLIAGLRATFDAT